MFVAKREEFKFFSTELSAMPTDKEDKEILNETPG